MLHKKTPFLLFYNRRGYNTVLKNDLEEYSKLNEEFNYNIFNSIDNDILIEGHKIIIDVFDDLKMIYGDSSNLADINVNINRECIEF